MLACLGRSLRGAAPCRWARTQFSISLEEFPAELAVARLNRKVQKAGLMTKWRRRQRGFIKPSRVKYDARLKRQYKLSYRRVQDVLTWIEMERMLSASQRKQRRRASKGRGPRSRAAAAAGRRKFIVWSFVYVLRHCLLVSYRPLARGIS